MNSLVLFGSCARGDNNENSDVDLLALTLDKETTRKSFENFIINIYSKCQLEQMTKEGSLFVWHLVKEGKIMFDSNNEYRNIIKSFKLKNDYSEERKIASDIGWLLLSKDIKNNRITVNILLYSIRTIVLTYLALKNIPAFSQEDMIVAFNDPLLKKLLGLKYKNGLTRLDLEFLQDFLIKYGCKKPDWLYQPISKIMNRNDLHDFIHVRSQQLMNMSSLFDFDTYHH